MDNNKRLFQLGILIIALLAMGLALLRTSSYNKEIFPSGNIYAEPKQETEQHFLAGLKDEEILGIDPQELTPDKELKRTQALQRYAPHTALSVQPKDYTLKNNFSLRNPYSELPSVTTGGGGLGDGYVYRPKKLSVPDYGKYPSSSSSYMSQSSGSVSDDMQGTGVYRPDAEEQMAAERQRAFSPYMDSLTKEQKEQLENQLKGLSSGIDRAVAKALLPKSKKEMNIEKYLQRNASPQAVAAGPFAPVLEQVAAQKAGVVKSMGQAFGQQAAQEASKVMDSFQNEMASAVNAPGKTPQQIAEKVKEVAQKYAQELQKMSEDNGFKKFEQERIEKDNLLKQEISKQYGPEIASQASKTIDEFREKDMLLARQGLPAEKYYEQQLANQSARRKALEELIIQHGKSTKGLFNAENELERKEVEQKIKDEEEGKTLARSYRTGEKELAAIGASLSQERDEKLQAAGEIYGEEGARRIDAVYQKYYDEYMKIWQDPDSSKTTKQQASMKLRQDVNKQLEQIQKDPKLQEERLNRQVENSLSQLMKSPDLQKASSEQKAALAQHARPILREMYEKVNEIVSSDLPDSEKQKRLQQIQEEAQRKLSGQ